MQLFTLVGMAAMLAWIFNGQTQLLAVLFTSSCWFVPQVADCQTPNASCMTADSLPVAKIPLPIAGSRDAQKPTSAVFNDAEISIVQWQIQPRTFNVGTQKSVQARSVCAAWISAPTHLESTPWQSPVLAVNTIPGNDAGRQYSSQVVPVDDQIVRIQWSNESHLKQPQSERFGHAKFEAEQCPFIDWEFRETAATEESEIGLCSELVARESFIGKAQLSSLENDVSSESNSEILAALRKLLPKPEPEVAVTYLTELQQLLQGDSNWLYVDEKLLEPPQQITTTAAISYLDDLNALVGIKAGVSSSHPYLNTVASQQTQSEDLPKNTPVPASNLGKPYTSISSDQKCNGADGVGVSSLFQSMSSIHVNGLSTAPPVQPRDAATAEAELARPRDEACKYMDSYSPAYYTTPMRYSAPRPMRDTYVFFHQPLYFENANLERCGQPHGCMTTTFSSVRFATAIIISPVLMAIDHPASCVQSLPDCPTYYRFPKNHKGHARH
ncbi:MAG: hypothetical protein NTX48_21960 [Planctomycetales bacterium]|nr:hypothetical protein [Planctomycetales bacterium]